MVSLLPACLPVVVVVAVVGSVFGVLCYVAAVFVSFFPSFVSRYYFFRITIGAQRACIVVSSAAVKFVVAQAASPLVAWGSPMQ